MHNDANLVAQIIPFLDFAALAKMKQANKQWKELCTKAIDDKCESPQSFQSNQELKEGSQKILHKEIL